jgi:hypothetical protein
MAQINNQNVGTTRLLAGGAPVPKVEYFKLSPSTSRYHQVMSTAADLGCPWQDIIREAIDFYLKHFPKKSN